MKQPQAGDRASWELPEAVWQAMEPLIPPRKSKEGRPRTVNLRRVAEGIFFVLRTGIQWNALPRERFGPPSTVSYYFRQWIAADVFKQLWAKALAAYDDLAGLEWTWQSIDGAMTKAPLGGGDGAQSHGPWQTWYQTQCPDGRARPAPCHRGRPCQPQRHEALGGNAGGRGGGTPAASTRGAAAFVRRQGLRLPHLPAGRGSARLSSPHPVPRRGAPGEDRLSRRAPTPVGGGSLSFMVQPVSQDPGALREIAADSSELVAVRLCLHRLQASVGC